jgi:DhnA family fructose-bisphosphate aldolase class Ia
MGEKEYNSEEFLSMKTLEQICDMRVSTPGLVVKEMQARKRRNVLAPDGKLTVLAADHPGRMVTRATTDPLGLGDRLQYLGRIVRVMLASEMDGLMGTSDVLEEVTMVNYLYKQKTGKSFLDGRVLLGCMNRGGVSGANAEMCDMMTSYMNGKRLKQMNLDGAKLMFRFSFNDERDYYCLETVEACAKAIEELNDEGLPAFLEVLAVKHDGEKFGVVKEPDALIKVIGVGTALGYTSSRTWLKIPFVPDFERVVRSTTCPILMLGGEATGKPLEVIKQFEQGLKAGPNVRGALVGRNVTFPGPHDPAAIAQAIYLVVHNGMTAEEAFKQAGSIDGTLMDVLD